MNVNNQTNQDLYFGPLHLLPNASNFYVDDTTATSLYLTNDSVADALNNAYNSGKVTVSGQAQPFPRPTGIPQVVHGDGNPEGLVFAPQGSVFLRRDGTQSNGGIVFAKATGVTFSTGWYANVAGLCQVANTVGGLGAPTNGMVGLVRAGASIYTEVPVIYDATKGHWVSPEFSVIAQGGSTFGISAFTSNAIVVYGIIDGYGDARTAGLNLELRASFWMGSNQSNNFSSWVVGIKSATVAAAYDTTFGNYTSLGTGGTNSSAIVGYDTGWVSAAGPASNSRAVVALGLSATNTGQNATLYYPNVKARWVA